VVGASGASSSGLDSPPQPRPKGATLDDRDATLSDDEILTEPVSPSAVIDDGDVTDTTDVGDSDADDMDSDDQDADADDL
jgi:hypothetical protein